MNSTMYRLPLLLATTLGLLVVVRLAAWPLVRVSLDVAPASAESTARSGPDGRIAAESVTAITTRDPFRVARRPVLPAYDPMRLAEQLAPPPPRPALALVGVVEGAAPSAVIEGFPGVEGSRVIRVGDVIAGLAIKKVGGGRVVITGMDTTWVLEVRQPWKN